MQNEIQEAAYRTSRRSSAASIVVGLNQFVMDEPAARDPLPGRSDRGSDMQSAWSGFRRSRARRRRAARALESVERAARGRDNLIPVILDAVRAHVTLGEICDTLRSVFGVHQPSVVF